MDTTASLLGLSIPIVLLLILVDLFSEGSENRKAIIRRTILGIVGFLVGGYVGYLLGASSFLTFADVLARGTTLKGVQLILRPRAESAFNYMLAGSIVGLVGALVFASLTPKRAALVQSATTNR